MRRSAVVSIFDNAFHLGRERPAVRLRAGGELTWRWRAQQSHQVTLRSGPEPLASPTKTAGTYAVQRDKPGRYTFVCSIHAPGMRMSAIVRLTSGRALSHQPGRGATVAHIAEWSDRPSSRTPWS